MNLKIKKDIDQFKIPWYKVVFNPFIIFLGKRKIQKNFHKPPVVIGGCDRSGTTLMISILGAHPHIFAYPKENGVFLNWVEKEGDKVPLRLDRLYREIIGRKIPQSANRYCHKNPANILHIREILDFYSDNVKIIQMVRDGRDVVTSVHPSKPDSYWVSVEKWVRDVKAGIDFYNHPNIHTVRYEDLTENPNKVIQELCKFLDEPVLDEIINWSDNTNLVKSNAWFHQAKQIHKNSVKKWEKPEHKERLKEFMNNKEAVSLLKKLAYL
ncbi:MAG: sulfotransferase [Leptospirales bacterium]